MTEEEKERILAAIRHAAAEYGLTETELRRSMESALAEGRRSTDDSVRAAWEKTPSKGDAPTMEEVFAYLTERLKNI